MSNKIVEGYLTSEFPNEERTNKLYSESLHFALLMLPEFKIQLTAEQSNKMFEILTIDQLKIMNERLESKVSWF